MLNRSKSMENGNISTHYWMLFPKCRVVDAIYDIEDETAVEKFLKESTAIRNKRAFATDLDNKYFGILTKPGFKLNYVFLC